MKRWLLYIGIFLIGIAVAVTFGAYQCYKEKGKTLIGPRVFGDIRIVSRKISANSKEVFIEKDGICFMIITQDSNDVTTEVSTVSKSNRASATSLEGSDFGGFTMVPLGTPGEWRCSYSCDLLNENFKGEFFEDLNFDNQFDIRLTFREGKKKERWIHIEDDWKKVYKVSREKAEDESNEYIFDSNNGQWQSVQ